MDQTLAPSSLGTRATPAGLPDASASKYAWGAETSLALVVILFLP
jgi:hypothetical protein